MKKYTICIIAFVALIAPISPVFAATATGVLNISTTLVPSCSVSTTPVDFGPISSPSGVTATGDVIVNCQSGFPYHIALDAGTNYIAGQQFRSLVLAGNPIPLFYTLAKLSGETWGDSDYANTFNFGNSLADTSNGSNQSHVVFGSLQVSPASEPGIYTGIVQVTVHW
jgi:spore coat protein U-like protein